MVHQSSSPEFRTLSAEEIEAVAGAGDHNYWNGNTLVSEHYDSDGWFTGASYYNSDGSGSSFDISGNSSSWGNSSTWGSGGYGYATGGFGYGGGVGGFSYVNGGDLYGYAGIGTPGPSGGVGLDADGDLSGLSLTLPAPSGVTGLVVDPLTGTVSQIEVGRVSPSLTYGVNLSEIGRHFYNTAELFAEGFVNQYYPQPDYNPDFQPQR